MTRKALKADQISNIENQTPSGSLVTRENVANLTYFLSSDQSQGINGQSITIDGGWSVVRYV
jgi:enoyl-[acyl-carrier-protein] reductase (NADH)